MAWVLTRGITTWRNEIDEVFPGRDKSTDGTIGDQSHASGTSGHNPDISGKAEYRDYDNLDEVRAADIDKDLRNPKFSMEQLIQWLVALGRAGHYLPFRYFIYNKRIWRKSTGWKTETYTGPSDHSDHAHFSGDYTQTADNWTSKLGLLAFVRSATGEGEMLVQKGDKGEDVKFWQNILVDLGYGNIMGEVDGDYGDKMEAAVNAFRKAKGSGPLNQISGWGGFALLRDMMNKRSGKDGAPGKPGAPGAPGTPGQPGKDGVLTGVLSVDGGTLRVSVPPTQ